MSKLKMHAKRELSYDPQTVGVAWTICHAHVEQHQIATFVPEGVTCKKCLASLTWRAENEREWAAKRFACSNCGMTRTSVALSNAQNGYRSTDPICCEVNL